MRASLLAALLAAGLAGAASAEPISVPLDHSVRVGLSGSASSVIVGNPGIADVNVVDSRTLFILGKGYGSTDLVVVDALGRTIYNAEIAVGAAPHGHVAVYRGGDKSAERTDMACDPRCQVAPKSSGAPSVVSALSTLGGSGRGPTTGNAPGSN